MNLQINQDERKPIPRPANGNRGFWIGVFVLVTMTLTAVGIWFYNNQSQAIKAEKTAELSAIAELKVNQIIQ